VEVRLGQTVDVVKDRRWSSWSLEEVEEETVKDWR